MLAERKEFIVNNTTLDEMTDPRERDRVFKFRDEQDREDRNPSKITRKDVEDIFKTIGIVVGNSEEGDSEKETITHELIPLHELIAPQEIIAPQEGLFSRTWRFIQSIWIFLTRTLFLFC